MLLLKLMNWHEESGARMKDQQKAQLTCFKVLGEICCGGATLLMLWLLRVLRLLQLRSNSAKVWRPFCSRQRKTT
jgi:hypothetical protein